MKKAIYPLSADPVHNGHIHTLAVAVNSGFFDEVIFAVGNNPAKKYLLSLEERVSLAKKAVYSSGLDSSKVKVEPFFGMLRNYAKTIGAEHIIRGARNPGDFEYELSLSDYNAEFGLQTIVFPATKEYASLSSGVVKAIAVEGGLVNQYVHPAVKQALEEKLRKTKLVGVTGNMGAGKTTFCSRIVKYAQNEGIDAHHLDYDKMIHELYFDDTPLAASVREQVHSLFGEEVFEKDRINRKKLAGITFGDNHKRVELAQILTIPSLISFENKLREMQGFVFVDAAYFTEYSMLPLVNYNMILLGCSEDERVKRIFSRDGITPEELVAKTKAQHSHDDKKRMITDAQKMIGHGFFYEQDTTTHPDCKSIMEALQKYFR